MSELGREVRRLREERGWSQNQLSVYADLSQPTVNQIETGKRNPSTATVVKLANALGVEVSDLFPKARSRSSREPTLLNGLEEERRADWSRAVENARQLQGGGRVRLEELLAEWQASRERGELRSARRQYTRELEQLFNEAYGATHALADILIAEGGIPTEADWDEVRTADRFYRALIQMMKDAGFTIRERASEPPALKEPGAA